MKLILFGIGALFVSTGAYMFVTPHIFYEQTPGVAMMGPFNTHFIRDAGLAFSTSGGALIWGGWSQNRPVAVFGAMWPSLHAAFHIWIWLARGMPLDQIAIVNLVGIQLPAWLALYAASNLNGART